MFNNISIIPTQISLLVYSWFMAILFTSLKALNKKNSHILILILGIVVILVVAIVRSHKAMVSLDFIEFLLNFLKTNVFDIGLFFVNLFISYLITHIPTFNQEKNNVYHIFLIALSSLVLIGTAFYYYNLPLEKQADIPNSILEKSYHTIPIEFMLENEDYFSNQLYKNVFPFEYNANAQNEDNSSQDPNTISHTQKIGADSIKYRPLTYTEHINTCLNEKDDEIAKNHVKTAYEMYIIGDVDDQANNETLAYMWFYLAFYDIYPENTVKYFKNALNIFKEINDIYNIAIVYTHLGDLENAITYYRKYYKDNSNNLNFRIDAVVSSMMLSTNRKEEYDYAIKYFSNLKSIGIITTELAKLYKKKEAYSDAINEYENAVSYFGNCDQAAYCLINIAEIYSKIHDYQRAESTYNRALNIPNTSSSSRFDIMMSYRKTAKKVYFSNYRKRYLFVINCFNACDPSHTEEMVYLYFQSIIKSKNTSLISSPMLEYFSGQCNTPDSQVFLYKPKILIYCCAIYVESGYEDKALYLLDKISEIYDKKPSNFNDFDIVNYVKLLTKFKKYHKAYYVLDQTRRNDYSEQISLHRNIMEPCIIYFAKTLNGQTISRSDSKKLIDLLNKVNLNSADPSSSLYKQKNYTLNLLKYMKGEAINYKDLLDPLPADKTINKYLSAYIEYKKNENYVAALNLCEEILNADPNSYNGFTKYDILLLDGEISLNYAKKLKVLSNSLKGEEKENYEIAIKDYLNRALQKYKSVQSDVNYLYIKSSIGIKQVEDLMGENYEIDVPLRQLIQNGI